MDFGTCSNSQLLQAGFEFSGDTKVWRYSYTTVLVVRRVVLRHFMGCPMLRTLPCTGMQICPS
jgi:hypothetical protein